MAPARPTTLRVATGDGVELAVSVHGSGGGRPLLLIAGTGYAAATWTDETIEAVARDRPVVVYDHRGIGKSGSSAGPYTTRGFADDVAAIVEALGGGPVHLLGHSMGGRIAQWVAIDRPELVASLVLAASGSGRAADGATGVSGVPYHTALGLARDGYRAHLAHQIRSTFFTPAFAVAQPDRVDWLVNAFWRSRPKLAEYLKHVVARQGHDTSGELRHIRAPTLVVVGTEDTHVGGTGSHWDQSRVLADGISGATFRPIEGVAHGLFWQTPEQTHAAVTAWLAGRP